MATLIPATVAGTFYPADAGELRERVRQYVSAAAPPVNVEPTAIIAPHAGYDYSGPIAGAAYGCLAPIADRAGRVVLVGTCHVRGIEGLATTSAKALQTPLGTVRVDANAVERALSLTNGHVTIRDKLHELDHSLQVQLPFLQCTLNNLAVAPFLVGHCTAADVAQILTALALEPHTLIVVSSDLSHYHDYETARDLDRQTAEAIVAFDAEAIGQENACGFRAIRGLLSVAAEQGWKCRALDVRNSGDTSGRRDRVVGYGAFVFEQGEKRK